MSMMGEQKGNYLKRMLCCSALFLSVFIFIGFVKTSSAAVTESAGAETCVTCHQDEQYKGSVHVNHTLPDLKGISSEKTCETCHGPGSLHAQAGGNKQDPDFATINGPTTNPKRLVDACLQCHSETHPFWKNSIHNRKGVTCNNCHNLHKVEAPGRDQGKLTKKETTTETCYQCHKDKKAHVARAAHMPIKEGKLTCTSCHNPHGTPYDKNLKTASPNQLCTSCHAEKRGPFLWEHAPVRENCLNCHDPHGSLHDKMILAKRPFILCQRCHVGGGHFSSEYDKAQIDQQSNRVINRACQNCHVNIHGSNHPSGKFLLR